MQRGQVGKPLTEGIVSTTQPGRTQPDLLPITGGCASRNKARRENQEQTHKLGPSCVNPGRSVTDDIFINIIS